MKYLNSHRYGSHDQIRFFLAEDMNRQSSLFQSHFEQISDYRLPGQGIWWKQSPNGIEFMDSSSESHFRSEGPKLMHFRSTSITSLQTYLSAQWEKCLSQRSRIPLSTVRTYTNTGDLVSLEMLDSDEGESDHDEEVIGTRLGHATLVSNPSPSDNYYQVPNENTNSNESTLYALLNDKDQMEPRENVHTSSTMPSLNSNANTPDIPGSKYPTISHPHQSAQTARRELVRPPPCMEDTSRKIIRTTLGKVLMDILPDKKLVAKYDAYRSKVKKKDEVK